MKNVNKGYWSRLDQGGVANVPAVADALEKRVLAAIAEAQDKNPDIEIGEAVALARHETGATLDFVIRVIERNLISDSGSTP